MLLLLLLLLLLLYYYYYIIIITCTNFRSILNTSVGLTMLWRHWMSRRRTRCLLKCCRSLSPSLNVLTFLWQATCWTSCSESPDTSCSLPVSRPVGVWWWVWNGGCEVLSVKWRCEVEGVKWWVWSGGWKVVGVNWWVCSGWCPIWRGVVG